MKINIRKLKFNSKTVKLLMAQLSKFMWKFSQSNIRCSQIKKQYLAMQIFVASNCIIQTFGRKSTDFIKSYFALHSFLTNEIFNELNVYT